MQIPKYIHHFVHVNFAWTPLAVDLGCWLIGSNIVHWLSGRYKGYGLPPNWFAGGVAVIGHGTLATREPKHFAGKT
jgi:hypothetical protein